MLVWHPVLGHLRTYCGKHLSVTSFFDSASMCAFFLASSEHYIVNFCLIVISSLDSGGV
jgi:hypothetical protein